MLTFCQNGYNFKKLLRAFSTNFQKASEDCLFFAKQYPFLLTNSAQGNLKVKNVLFDLFSPNNDMILKANRHSVMYYA